MPDAVKEPMLASSTNASVRDIGNKLKAGFSSDAEAASSGRTVEPVVLMLTESGKLGSPGMKGFPRDKSLDGSSLFFMVQPFLGSIGIGNPVLRPLLTSALPSPRACSLEVVIWYTDLLEIPISHRGLKPHKPMPMTGVPMRST
jgi:hypothetical protein